jgi:hypothetical protein
MPVAGMRKAKMGESLAGPVLEPSSDAMTAPAELSNETFASNAEMESIFTVTRSPAVNEY